jgi:hypothetical protein
MPVSERPAHVRVHVRIVERGPLVTIAGERVMADLSAVPIRQPGDLGQSIAGVVLPGQGEELVERFFRLPGKQIVGAGFGEHVGRMAGGRGPAEHDLGRREEPHGSDELLDLLHLARLDAPAHDVRTETDQLQEERPTHGHQSVSDILRERPVGLDQSSGIGLPLGESADRCDELGPQRQARLERDDRRLGQPFMLGPRGDFQHPAGPAGTAEQDPHFAYNCGFHRLSDAAGGCGGLASALAWG